MLTIDLSGFKEFQRDLAQLRERSIPHAVRSALNDAAFDARKIWLTEVKEKLTLRNSYTERSMRVEKARGTKLAGMQSVLGSTAEHMAHQEQGQTHTTSGKHGVAVPTSAASGQGLKSKRTKSIRRANYLSAINLSKRVTGIRQRRNAAALAMAARSGGGFVYLDLGRRKGIFRVDGRKRGLRIRMVYDLSRRITKAKPTATLTYTVATMGPRVPMLIQRAVMEQLTRTAFKTKRR